MADAAVIPPPPEGFKIDEIPPPPPGFSITGGGAASGFARQNNRPRVSPLVEGAASVAGATGIGAIGGAMLPEILTAAGAGASAFPVTAGAAPWLNAAATAARAAGRPAGALMGAVSGAASETAGQVADQFGVPTPIAEGVRFLAGGITPESLTAAKWVFDRYIKTPSLSLGSKIQKESLKQIGAWISGRPQDISEQEAAVLNQMVDDLRGGAKSDAPLKATYDTLQRGAKNKLAVGAQQADEILTNAERAIKNESDRVTGDVSRIGDIKARLASRGEDALAVAQQQRLNIGNDVDPTDLGSALRGAIVKRHEAEIAARKESDNAIRASRDAAVAARERAGNYVNGTPQYRQMVASLESELEPGKRSPEVAATFRNILKGITAKDAEGNTVPVTFQALDDVRRSLGEAYRGKPPEGFAGIDAATAKKYYEKINAIQEQFVPQHRLVQSRYADQTAGMEVFGTRSGKKATALDGYIDDAYQTDASLLPKDYFSSKTKINDLIELTGNRSLVVNSAKDFSATELANLTTESQVRDWMTKRRELLSAIPEVRDSVLSYANSLARAERISAMAEDRIKKLSASESKRLSGLKSATEATLTDAERAASGVTSAAQSEANLLTGSRGTMFPSQRVKDLILKGNTQEWTAAAPLILREQGGQQRFIESVRQTLAEKATKSTNDLSGFFDNNVVPALQATKIMPQAEIDAISAQLSAIENMKVPEQTKIGLARRLVLQSFGGLAASIGGRGYGNAASGLVNLIPSNDHLKQGQ